MAANGIDLAELPDARITIDPRQYHSLINTVHIEIRGKLHWDIGRTSSQPSYMMKINESNLDWKNYDQGKIQFHRKELSNAVEAENLGCSLYELPPGKQSWPYHYHTANEEAVFVLAGEGQLRTEGGEKPLQSGDFITLPADERGGHQVVNDDDESLRYLMVSTMNEPDVTIYPEMGKFGVFVGAPPGGRDDRTFHGFYNINEKTEYWEE